MIFRRIVATIALLGAVGAAEATCFEEAGAYYGMSPVMLRAIQAIENKAGDPQAIRYNSNGTIDYGLMQINSIWLNEIARYGYTSAHLMDPCLNVVISAWILARHLSKHGVTWEAVGRYHSATPDRRDQYAAKVQAQFIRMGGYGQAYN